MHKFFDFVEKLTAPLSTKWKYRLAFALFALVVFSPALGAIYGTVTAYVVSGLFQLLFSFFAGTVYGLAAWETREAHYADIFATLTALRSDIEDKLAELKAANESN